MEILEIMNLNDALFDFGVVILKKKATIFWICMPEYFS